ncbi:uncharacterized protein K452DRAFT_299083 [Aplosporella prunicola CBS 121167]|uniref:DUF221-domain-containing protein n=1 Tax=Aplosporella prunicola CBS 121167 TaxID=1176127 RepID=A0A6A6BEW5_9PEZI|nr:uncharacterized protein K452DRAFT_299083 [Aplosporella prunicola CBS 121167]KAF2141021.1 hypothetical protein K452DRAFT_299083 [Aplosporella prunicola CBS 121167]
MAAMGLQVVLSPQDTQQSFVQMLSNNLPKVLDDNSGSHRDKSPSLYGLIYTLIPAVLLAIVLLSTFFGLRGKLRRLYIPRTFLDTLTEEEKTPQASNTAFGWIKFFERTSDTLVLNSQSLDGYLFVRFFKIVVVICFIGFLITGTILLPINATGGGGQHQLDRLSFSNVKDPNRYYAHTFVAWVFFGFVLFMITRETIYLIHLRQAYLLSPWNSSRISSRTVLFTSVPKTYRNEEKLKSIFDEIKQVWLVEDFKKLEGNVEKMDKAAMRLEYAEIKLIKDTNARRLKELKKRKPERGRSPERASPGRWVNLQRRPKQTVGFRLNFLMGHRVDTISYSRKQLHKQIPEIRADQKMHLDGDTKLLGAVFVEFETQSAAQAAYSLVSYNHPGRMVPRQVGILPNEVIWKHLRIPDWEVSLRQLIATALICLMTIFWGIPVAFVGSISNVQYLSKKYAWLHWIDSLSDKQVGVLTGLLPALLLGLLTTIVPKICRLVAKHAGSVTLSQVELRTQIYYFIFSLIQVFLVTTFSSGATAVFGEIAREPSSAPTLLAQNLPKASNFYISYFILYGVAMSAVYVFNPAGLFFYVILPKIWPYSTPRESYNAYITLESPNFGSEAAKWTNLAVIAISYSCIAPLVLGFATVGFGLIYLALRYNFIYVFDTDIDTKGAFYAQALQQMIVGVYIAELCLIGLFASRSGSTSTANGPLILTVALFIATLLYHYWMHKTLKPLTELLPRNLLTETEQGYDDALTAEHGDAGARQPLLTPTSPDHDGEDGHTATRVNAIQVLAKHAESHNWLRRFFTPRTSSVAAIAKSLHPGLRQPVPPYPQEVARAAYINPVITREPPVLWIVKDDMGLSEREIVETREEVGAEGVEMTDKGAWLDEKNGIVWDEERLREMPLWKGRVVY